jgi:hypothetical protein
VGVVAGAWQQQAAAEHEPACGRGGCGRERGVRACEGAERVGACVMVAARLACLHSRGERSGGVGARRGLCEGMRVRGGGAVTDRVFRVVVRGSFGVLCCGVGADTTGTTATT